MSDIDQRMKNAEESGAGAPENNGAAESAEADAKKARLKAQKQMQRKQLSEVLFPDRRRRRTKRRKWIRSTS